MSFTFRNTNIYNVLRAFSTAGNISIIAGKKVDDVKITAEIKNQPWREALDALLDGQGLVMRELPSGIISVDAKSTLAENQQQDPVDTRYFRLTYQRADSLVQSVEAMISKRGNVVADRATNSIIATEVPMVLDRIASIIAEADQPQKEVEITSKMVFISTTELDAMGFQLDLKDSKGPTGFPDLVPTPPPGSNGQVSGTPGVNPPVPGGVGGIPGQIGLVQPPSVSLTQTSAAGVIKPGRVANPSARLLSTLASVNSRFTVVTFVDLLRQVDLARTESKPAVRTMNNQEASIVVGEEIPVRVLDAGAMGGGMQQQQMQNPAMMNVRQGLQQAVATVRFKEVGVKLKVKPQISFDGNTMLLDVAVENSAARISSADIGLTFAKQSVTNRIFAFDGETSVLGGMSQTDRSSATTKVPYLSDLPLLGRFFQTKQSQMLKRDLVIFLTPRVVQRPAGMTQPKAKTRRRE